MESQGTWQGKGKAEQKEQREGGHSEVTRYACVQTTGKEDAVRDEAEEEGKANHRKSCYRVQAHTAGTQQANKLRDKLLGQGIV